MASTGYLEPLKIKDNPPAAPFPIISPQHLTTSNNWLLSTLDITPSPSLLEFAGIACDTIPHRPTQSTSSLHQAIFSQYPPTPPLLQHFEGAGSPLSSPEDIDPISLLDSPKELISIESFLSDPKCDHFGYNSLGHPATYSNIVDPKKIFPTRFDAAAGLTADLDMAPKRQKAPQAPMTPSRNQKSAARGIPRGFKSERQDTPSMTETMVSTRSADTRTATPAMEQYRHRSLKQPDATASQSSRSRSQTWVGPASSSLGASEERATRTVLAAMKDMSQAEDNQGVRDTWVRIMNAKNPKLDQVASEIAQLIHKAHNQNPLPLGEKKIFNRYRAVEDRFDAVCHALRTQKTICKHLLEDPYIVQVVDDPINATKRVQNNRRVNHQKKEAIETGRRQLGLQGQGKGMSLRRLDDDIELGSPFTPSRKSSSSQQDADSQENQTDRPKRAATKRNYVDGSDEEEAERVIPSNFVSPSKKIKKERMPSNRTRSVSDIPGHLTSAEHHRSMSEASLHDQFVFGNSSPMFHTERGMQTSGQGPAGVPSNDMFATAYAMPNFGGMASTSTGLVHSNSTPCMGFNNPVRAAHNQAYTVAEEVPDSDSTGKGGNDEQYDPYA